MCDRLDAEHGGLVVVLIVELGDEQSPLPLLSLVLAASAAATSAPWPGFTARRSLSC